MQKVAKQYIYEDFTIYLGVFVFVFYVQLYRYSMIQYVHNVELSPTNS